VSDSNRACVAGGIRTTGRACSRELVATGYELTATTRDEDGAAAVADSALADETIELGGPQRGPSTARPLPPNLIRECARPRVDLTSVEDFRGAEFAPASAGAAERS
jgi:NAD(P)-dependent dehydrogenase (short-subunit alcohol dehydrogenase family)